MTTLVPPASSNVTSDTTTVAPEETNTTTIADVSLDQPTPTTTDSMTTPAPSRPEGTRLFSPRSTAALALSSFSQRPDVTTSNDAENNPNNANNDAPDNENANNVAKKEVTVTDANNNNAASEVVVKTANEKKKNPLQPLAPVKRESSVPTYSHHPHAPLPPPAHHHHHGYHPGYPPYGQSSKRSGSPPMEHMMPPMSMYMPPPPVHGNIAQSQRGPSPTHGESGERWWQPPPMPQNNYYMMPPHGRHHPAYGQHPSMPPYGYMPMDPRMPPYHPSMMMPGKPFHERGWDTPHNDAKRFRKAAEDPYSRKLKSLGMLAETFVKQHKDLPAETCVVVDDVARMLGVERRRVYDVVNILESVGVVVKKSKNTYIWMGMDVMPYSLGKLQDEAVARYPDDALSAGIITEEEADHFKLNPPSEESIHHKTLNRLTQQYLHVYLVGHDTLSLPEASDKIHGSESTMTELAKLGGWDGTDDPTGLEVHKAASKGLKTKIRRLYDVSNVLCHLNWIKKMAPGLTQPKLQNDIAPLLLERRPQYKWNYMTPQEIRKSYVHVVANAPQAPSQNVPSTLHESHHHEPHQHESHRLIEYPQTQMHQHMHHGHMPTSGPAQTRRVSLHSDHPLAPQGYHHSSSGMPPIGARRISLEAGNDV